MGLTFTLLCFANCGPEFSGCGFAHTLAPDSLTCLWSRLAPSYGNGIENFTPSQKWRRVGAHGQRVFVGRVP